MKLPDKFEFEKTVMWHYIGHGIKWRYYRHWGQNCYAGEKYYNLNEFGIQDRSGCLSKDCKVQTPLDSPGHGRWLVMDMCDRPVVFLAREYWKGNKRISAVLSYPDGFGSVDRYFWEIWPNKDGDCSRFFSEKKMESVIVKLLSKNKPRKKRRL